MAATDENWLRQLKMANVYSDFIGKFMKTGLAIVLNDETKQLNHIFFEHPELVR